MSKISNQKTPQKNEKIRVLKFTAEHGFFTTKVRSSLMSKIGSKETKPEIVFRKALWASGVRYRKNYKKLPGSPDILINKLKIVIFIDGEFWHGYNWTDKKNKIKVNRDFWIPKIERNMQRDLENNSALKLMGYKVFRFWEHEIKKDLVNCIEKVIQEIAKTTNNNA